MSQKKKSHNPYFSGNSFATDCDGSITSSHRSHNPYFSGNSFATGGYGATFDYVFESQSLF